MGPVALLSGIIRRYESVSDRPATTVTPAQLAVLSVIRESNWRINGKQRMQKLVFLLDEEYIGDDVSLYSWRKYDHGPHAKQLNKDLRSLDRSDLITIHQTPTLGGNTRYKYQLTDDGDRALDAARDEYSDMDELISLTSSVVTDHGEKPISNLIREVRDDHPKYWENSVYIT